MYNVKIIGTGSYVPDKILTNEYLETIIDTKASWIYENLGILERHVCNSNQKTSDIAYEAARRAIESSGLHATDINLIIVATSTPDRLAPSTACIVQEKLGAYNAAAFDLAAVCSGFLFSLSVANQYIISGMFDNILVIGADTFSKITDWTRRDAVFFGDGAGAVILSKSKEDSGFLSTKLYSDGKGKFNFTIPAGGSEFPSTLETIQQKMHFFQMNGKAVFETAIKALPMAIEQVLKDANLTIKDIDYMIPHQPSINILKKTAEIIGLPFSKVMTNMEKYANTSGGTIPIMLDEVNKSGKLQTGNLVLFAAVGSGWTYGASIFKW
jgi:3-oxoacyl-[acyl-carrier-protein] synthase-3